MPSTPPRFRDSVGYTSSNLAHNDIYYSKIDNQGFTCIRNFSENRLKDGRTLISGITGGVFIVKYAGYKGWMWLVGHYLGSSPVGVLWSVLAILMVDSPGEGHEQDKTKETEIHKLKMKAEH